MSIYDKNAHLVNFFVDKTLIVWYSYIAWPYGQGVKTPPSQGGITSSNLVKATKKIKKPPKVWWFLFLFFKD